MTAKDFQPTELYWPHGFGGHRRMVARRIVYLQHVSPDVVLQGPVQGMEDLEDLILLQHTEEPVQQDFQANWDGLSPIEHQAADIKHDVGLNNLHLACGIHRRDPQLAQS